MNDLYSECLVKRKTPAKYTAVKTMLLVITVLVIAASVFIPLVIYVGLLLIVLNVFLFRRWDLEYEYIYYDKELQIDKIMGKSKRKKAAEFNLQNLEIMAPADSYLLDGYKSVQYREMDFTSLEEGHKVYVMIVGGDKERVKVRFEPDGQLLKGMKLGAPSKVHI